MRTYHDVIWICAQFIVPALALGIAALMVRHRRPFRWLILAGAFAFSAEELRSGVVATLHLLGWHEWARSIQWRSLWGRVDVIGLIFFLLGILCQSLRQAGESTRIAELEAILQDPQRPVPDDRR